MLGGSAGRRLVVGFVAAFAGVAVAPGTSPSAAQSAEPAASAVVRRYAPIVRLAKGEEWRPISAAAFIEQSSLRWAHDDNCPNDHEVAGNGDVDAGRLGSGGYSHQAALPPVGLCRHFGREYRSDDFTRPRDPGHGRDGTPPTDEGFFLDFTGDRHGQGVRAPVYYEYHPKEYVTYWFFYAFNDAPSSPSTFGDHEGDWERVTVRLNGRNRATQIAYFQHDGDPCVLRWSSRRVQKRGGHPVVFSAKGTHASYPRAGHFPLPGPPEDEASHGRTWATYRSLRNARTQPWFNFGGAWGEVGELKESTGPLGPSAAKGAVPDDWGVGCD